MELDKILIEFFRNVKEKSIDIYNEASLQCELVLYIRSNISKNFTVQVERNIDYFTFSKDFVKKKIDLVIYKEKKELENMCVIELKAPLNQEHARPVTIYNWIIDLKFLEQLRNKGIANCYSIFITDHKGYFYDKRAGKLLSDFRARKIHGQYKKHRNSSKLKEIINLTETYSFEWNEITRDIKYFLIKISNCV